MWIGDTIYYNSDRDGHFNLYAYGVGNGKRHRSRITSSGTCAGPVPIMATASFMKWMASLQVLDMKSGKATPISINVPDDGLARRPSRVSAATTSSHGI
jgi:tricorn protease